MEKNKKFKVAVKNTFTVTKKETEHFAGKDEKDTIKNAVLAKINALLCAGYSIEDLFDIKIIKS